MLAADPAVAYDPWQVVVTHRFEDGRSLSCASAPWLVAAMLDQLEARRFADSWACRWRNLHSNPGISRGPGWGCRDRSTRRRRGTQRNRDEVREQRKDAVIKKAAKHYQR